MKHLLRKVKGAMWLSLPTMVFFGVFVGVIHE